MRFYIDQIEKDIITEPCCTGSVSSIESSKWNFWSYLFGVNQKLFGQKDCDSKKRALVIDGRTLAYILDQPLDEIFLNLARRCTSVLCCRATPLQKVTFLYIISK